MAARRDGAPSGDSLQRHDCMKTFFLSVQLFHPPSQFHNLQELRHSASLANKVFIQRDYSEGTTCKFQTKFPSELESRVRAGMNVANLQCITTITQTTFKPATRVCPDRAEFV